MYSARPSTKFNCWVCKIESTSALHKPIRFIPEGVGKTWLDMKTGEAAKRIEGVLQQDIAHREGRQRNK